MKKMIAALLLVSLLVSLAACGAAPAEKAAAPAETAAPETTAVPETEAAETEPAAAEEAAEATVLPDGVYSVDFDTDSSMFHINEALNGKGTLTVEGDKMTVHITLVSKSILKLFPGSAEDAQKEGAVWLEPTEDEVTYSDGYTETVYGFDVPVEVLDAEFALALIGKKGTWYDHTVKVSNPELIER